MPLDDYVSRIGCETCGGKIRCVCHELQECEVCGESWNMQDMTEDCGLWYCPECQVELEE